MVGAVLVVVVALESLSVEEREKELKRHEWILRIMRKEWTYLSTLENGLGIGVADLDAEGCCRDDADTDSEFVDMDFLIAPIVADAALDADVDACLLSASKRLLVGMPLLIVVVEAVPGLQTWSAGNRCEGQKSLRHF